MSLYLDIMNLSPLLFMKNTLITLLLAASSAVAYADDYPVAAGKTAAHTHASRLLNGIVLATPDGSQTIAVPQGANRLLYQDLLTQAFTARPGQTLTPQFVWSGTWMNGFVYLDFGNDGSFDATVQPDGKPAEGSDVVAYSYCNGRNSAGQAVSGGNVLNPPSFTLPAQLPYGVYRMRYKVDWDFLDAAGSDVSGNDIIKNGGAIADTRLIVHGDEVQVQLCAEDADVPLATYVAPFGQSFALPVSESVPQGKVVKSVHVRHGFNLDGEALLHGTPQYVDESVSFLSIHDGTLFLPAGMVDGDVRIRLQFADANHPDDAALNALPESGAKVDGFSLTKVSLAGSRTRNYAPETPDAAYHDFTSAAALPLLPGAAATLKLSGSHLVEGQTKALTTADARLFVDYDHDGRFLSALESHPDASKFSLPEALQPGTYHARLYFPADDVKVDFSILVHQSAIRFTASSPHGRLLAKTVYDASGNRTSGRGIPTAIAPFRAQTFTAEPLVEGYSASGVEVAVTGPDGQRSEYSVRLNTLNAFSLNADSLYGDVEVRVVFTPDADAAQGSALLPVLVEEFDADALNSDLWATSQRQGAAWNRFIVDDPRVAFMEDGSLVCRCFANPGDIKGYTEQMVSGAKQSRGKFFFNHGYIEARILTTPHSGNFPAFWLMPEDQTGGWPSCGEIDIWETINTEDRAYHTIHSHWSYDLGHGGNGGNEACVNENQWHTYGLLKEADKLTWYMDGEKVFTYSKSTSNSELSQGQWPFDKAFYIILNQSVGTGSWAAAPDPSFTYETRFDWVRVYQSADDAQADGNEVLGIHAVELPSAPAAQSGIFDLSGRRVAQPTPGSIYIVNGRLQLAR